MSAAAPPNIEQVKKDLETLILQYLAEHESIEDSLSWMARLGRSNEHELLESVVRSLSSIEFVSFVSTDRQSFKLQAEAKKYLLKGSPEFQLLRVLAQNPKEGGLSKEEIEAKLGSDVSISVASANAMKNQWVQPNKATKTFELHSKLNANEVTDTVQQQLQHIEQHRTAPSADAIPALKKRNLISEVIIKSLSIKKAARFALQRAELATDLTFDLIKSGKWEKQQFKPYNFEALPPPVQIGTLHPLLKVRAEFRSILLSMGFSEMPTHRFVESSFWNFDALFQPQQHPSRDSHDTFFLTSPSTANLSKLDADYVQRVKNVHEKGGFGSIGYRYDWKLEEAEKNLLRTHTTAVSTRMLYQLAQECAHNGGRFRPVRYFSIDRVFRNETLDATHLAEFHQVEGVIADRSITLADLIGTIKTFFHRIGLTNLRFKPAFNPYTEPSMEIFGFSNELNKWIEIGNSGIFRTEMLKPMGLPDDVRVIAWGLSLERPTMIKYGIRNIRDLFGHKVKLDIIAKNGVARFDQYNPAI